MHTPPRPAADRLLHHLEHLVGRPPTLQELAHIIDLVLLAADESRAARIAAIDDRMASLEDDDHD